MGFNSAFKELNSTEKRTFMSAFCRLEFRVTENRYKTQANKMHNIIN